jgi:hypothetical protein
MELAFIAIIVHCTLPRLWGEISYSTTKLSFDRLAK